MYSTYSSCISKMHDEYVEYIYTLFEVQSFRNFAARMLTRMSQDLAGMRVTAARNFIGDVMHFENMRARAKVGNERAATRNAMDVSFISQFPERAIRGHAGNVHRLH